MKKRVLSALLALCLTLSLAGAAFAENETLSPAQETSASESASSAAEPQEEKESEVEAEEISTAETAQEPSYPAQDFEAEVEGTEVVVNVSAPEGALPEDVTLTASLVGSSEDNADDQAVADVAAELDDADVEYDGFVALDISFVDADGNKVEPLQPVSVNFTLPAELLPEDVDASTLEVQHLKEDAETEEVVAVETVADTADATEGTVTVDAPAATLSEDAEATLPADAAVNAEFAVDGFSKFIVTYTRYGSLGWTEESETIQFTLKDTDGQEIGGNDNFEVSFSTKGNIADLGKQVEYSVDEILSQANLNGSPSDLHTVEYNGETYKFVTAIYVNGIQRHPIDKIEFGRYTGGTPQHTTRIGMRLRDAIINDYYTVFDDSYARLELIYRNENESTGVVTEPDPQYAKTVTDNEDGTYNLTLSVSGDVGSSTDVQKVDALFIIDGSASMQDRITGGDTRVQEVQNAIQGLVNTLDAAQTAGRVDVRYAAVQFGDNVPNNNQEHYKDGFQLASWTKTASEFLEKINNISTKDGTNYQAGLLDAQASLVEARPDATRYIVFLSDGAPTRYYDENGNQQGSGTETPTNINNSLNAAIKEAANIPAINAFYTIYIGEKGSENATNLKRLNDAVSNAKEHDYYTVDSVSELQDAFNQIVGHITTLPCKNVSITDTLSNWVEPVDQVGPTFTILDDTGKEVDVDGEGCVSQDSIYYNWIDGGSGSDKSFGITLNPEYQLKQGYVYQLKLTIQPTEDAFKEYAENGYPKENGMVTQGAPGTGDFAGKDGFYTNLADSAKLKYVTNLSPEEKTKDYPMPVIQVPSTSITINKGFVKNDGTVLTQNEIESILPIDFTVKNGDEVISTVQLTKDDRKEDGTYSVEVPNLVVTKTYTIEENSTSAQLSGYDLAVSVDKPQDAGSAVASIVANKDVSKNAVTFTNTYTPQNKQLTVTKTVTGEMGSNDKSFDFTLSLTKTKNGNTVYYGAKSGETIKVVSSNMEEYEQDKVIVPDVASTGEVTYSFKLKHGKQIVFDVPYGYTATLHEEADGYTATFTVDGKPVGGAQPAPVMDQNHTVAYTNRLDPVAPTGLEDNHTKPFGLMVGVAVMAGLALAGGAVVRRRRRWME